MGDEVSDVLRPTSKLLRRAGDGSLEGKSIVIFDLITCGVESWTEVSLLAGDGDRTICCTGVIAFRVSAGFGKSASFVCEAATCLSATVGTSLTISTCAVLGLGVSNIWAGLNKAGIGRIA